MTGFASLQDGWGHRSILARGGKQGRLCRGESTSHTSSSTVPRYLIWSLLSWASGSLLLWEIWALWHGNTALVWFWPRVSAESQRGLDFPFYFLVWAVFLPLYPFSANTFLFLLEHNELFLSNFAGLPRIGLEICSYLIHVSVCLYYLMQTRTLLSSASYWSQQVTYTEGGNTWFISPQSPFTGNSIWNKSNKGAENVLRPRHNCLCLILTIRKKL